MPPSLTRLGFLRPDQPTTAGTPPSLTRLGFLRSDRHGDATIARFFPGWTLAVGNGYIFPDNPGKVRSLGGLPPIPSDRPAPLAAQPRPAVGPQEES